MGIGVNSVLKINWTVVADPHTKWQCQALRTSTRGGTSSIPSPTSPLRGGARSTSSGRPWRSSWKAPTWRRCWTCTRRSTRACTATASSRATHSSTSYHLGVWAPVQAGLEAAQGGHAPASAQLQPAVARAGWAGPGPDPCPGAVGYRDLILTFSHELGPSAITSSFWAPSRAARRSSWRRPRAAMYSQRTWRRPWPWSWSGESGLTWSRRPGDVKAGIEAWRDPARGPRSSPISSPISSPQPGPGRRLWSNLDCRDGSRSLPGVSIKKEFKSFQIVVHHVRAARHGGHVCLLLPAVGLCKHGGERPHFSPVSTTSLGRLELSCQYHDRCRGAAPTGKGKRHTWSCGGGHDWQGQGVEPQDCPWEIWSSPTGDCHFLHPGALLPALLPGEFLRRQTPISTRREEEEKGVDDSVSASSTIPM